MFHTPGFTQGLKLFRTEHFAQSIRGIDSTINEYMRHMNALGTKLGIKGLAQHTPPAHCCSMGVLTSIAPHRSSGRCHQYGASAALFH